MALNLEFGFSGRVKSMHGDFAWRIDVVVVTRNYLKLPALFVFVPNPHLPSWVFIFDAMLSLETPLRSKVITLKPRVISTVANMMDSDSILSSSKSSSIGIHEPKLSKDSVCKIFNLKNIIYYSFQNIVWKFEFPVQFCERAVWNAGVYYASRIWSLSHPI